MRIRFLFASILLITNGLFPVAHSATTAQPLSPLLLTTSHQVSLEKTRNTLLANKLAALQQQASTKINNITPDILQHAELAMSLAKADLDSIALTLTNARDDSNVTQNNIANLSQQLRNFIPSINQNNTKQLELQTQLNEQQSLLKIQQQRIKILESAQQLSQQSLQVAQEWKNQLLNSYQQQQQTQRQQNLEQLAVSLQAEQQNWLQRLADLNKQLQSSGAYGVINSETYNNLEMGIMEADERSNLTQIQLQIARLSASLENLNFTPGQITTLAVLNNLKHQTDTLAIALGNMGASLQEKIQLLQKRILIIQQGMQQGTINSNDGQASLAILNGLIGDYQKQFGNNQILEQKAKNYQSNIAKQLNQQISSRQGLPGFDIQAWEQLGQRLLEIPALAWQALQNIRQPLTVIIYSATIWQWLGWALIIIGWGIIWRLFHFYLKAGTERFAKRKQSVLSSNLFLVCLNLLNRYLPGFMLLAILIVLPFLSSIPLQSFSLIISLALVVFIFNLINGFARILLLENTTDKSGRDVQLYYRLKWALIIGGMITTCTVLVHQLPVVYNIQDFSDRLFMLFLLVVALVLLRAWKIVPTLLEPYLEDKRPYLKQTVRWLSLLIPISIFSNALIGLIGYVVLAWSIAAYQGLFLIVLTGYILARGILGEIMSVISGQMIRHMRNGWLWSEALLKPLHQILKLAVLIGAVIILFLLYGWGSNSWVVNRLYELLNLRLFALAGSAITPLSLVELAVNIAILIWAARWTREFAYRWLFSQTKDLGLRNSLAIFSQYILVIIGILIALKVLGINLTALTVVASAFAFGVGLGLRDLANNFMCGILLLIERPVHVGDYVTMAGMDGEVVHIGMRAITLVNDDHQEFLVPNALAFSQAFVNWTHRDSIVRIPITIKVSREDNPHRVKEIILDVLRNTPKILTNPPPNVYLKELADVLLKFELEYYVDLRTIPSRSSVRSMFLLSLWDRFQAEGIHAPEYPHEIILKNAEANKQVEFQKNMS